LSVGGVLGVFSVLLKGARAKGRFNEEKGSFLNRKRERGREAVF